MIDGSQVRGARAVLKLTVAELSRAAGVAPNTVTRVEADKPVNTSTLGAIRRALESAGIELIPENGSGAGIRLRKVGSDAL